MQITIIIEFSKDCPKELLDNLEEKNFTIIAFADESSDYYAPGGSILRRVSDSEYHCIYNSNEEDARPPFTKNELFYHKIMKQTSFRFYQYFETIRKD